MAVVLGLSENDTPPLHQPRPELLETNSCLENGVRRILEPLRVIQIQVDVSGFRTFRAASSLTGRRLSAKRQRIADCAKILLDISKEPSDWFPPLKSALGGVTTLIKDYEVPVESTDESPQLTRTLAGIRRCQGESRGSYSAVGETQAERYGDSS